MGSPAEKSPATRPRRMEKLSKCARKLKKMLLTPLRLKRFCEKPISASTSRAVRCEELFLSSQRHIKGRIRTRNDYVEDRFITPHIAAQNHFIFRA
ncbi:hypothetical protein GH714_031422 [Hevea brasiliensis]|uniref:Uncharacterized protein n=1 Tax=Hevea brasiliensis TaxID=3981 RepID=A0A6A6K7Z9_HEVBR|nr:hypothetical protein GH714_031422 [Hevea brasiliensis]